jgi:hypothetical protein
MLNERLEARGTSPRAVFCAAVGAVMVAWLLVLSWRGGAFGFDFHGTIWQAGKDILHGRSPYPAADPAELERQGNPAVYPAWTLVATLPFSLLPFRAAAIVWDLVSVVAIGAALRLVGVGDWRVFAIVFLSFPTVSSLKLGQFDALLALGCGMAWRWRDDPRLRLPACVGAVAAAKLLLLPLLVWLVACGRKRQAAAAAALGAALAVAGWAVVGFATLWSYPHLLSALTDAFATRGYSLAAAGSRLGLSLAVSKFFPLVAMLILCGLALRFGRSGHKADAFIAAVGASIIGSPILWLHYIVIVLVAVAVKRPRFCAMWLLPLAFWLTPTEIAGSGLKLALGLGLLVLFVALALGRRQHSVELHRQQHVTAPASRG